MAAYTLLTALDARSGARVILSKTRLVQVEYLGVSGMMLQPIEAAPGPASEVPGMLVEPSSNVGPHSTDSASVGVGVGDILSNCGGLEGYLSMMPPCD